ncbi:MAG: carbamoyltransferase HypF [Polyangiaceae bacterium]|nr:carbamoyltransferase HypF [Polyangiaceae bacterium]
MADATRPVRRVLRVSGIVQGVGFRPFVYGRARALGLAGHVLNEGSDVVIDVEGSAAAIARLRSQLEADSPPRSDIRAVSMEEHPPLGRSGFSIVQSVGTHGPGRRLPPDTATCDACLREIRDPAERRHGHPFANCTDCGPRLSIVRDAPYDRSRTTMAAFALCPACQREYDDPTNRRFHAQPIACPACGPRLSLLSESGAPCSAVDPLAECARRLLAGQIGALKGLGGFHLACDATRSSVVAELRRRKLRDDKPFALMVANLEAAEAIAELDDAARALLCSVERPIVLVRQRADASLPDSLAPGLERIGLMLPYTPLHHLLLDAVEPMPLVMTSGNRSDEPMATDNARALEELRGVADFFLVHDRDIFIRVDDSVVALLDGAPSVLRRARGFAPRAIELPHALSIPTLGVGAQFKNVFALGEGTTALPSSHIGDLDTRAAQEELTRCYDLYRRLLCIEPERIVHDLHPDYASTRWARELATRTGAELCAVQHHHAHFAACLAENEHQGAALGVTFDGMGLGADGTSWGGEFLLGTAADVERVATLAPLRLPGGDAAVREPWRIALGWLHDAGIAPSRVAALSTLEPTQLERVSRLLHSRTLCPRASGAGRYFDAVAALLGLTLVSTFDGQAPMRLEALAHRAEARLPPYSFAVSDAWPREVDLRPALAELVDDLAQPLPRPTIALRFHDTMAEVIRVVVRAPGATRTTRTVALSGGVFCNSLLTERTLSLLRDDDLTVLVHRRVPTGDGGIALGQLAVLAARDERGASALGRSDAGTTGGKEPAGGA